MPDISFLLRPRLTHTLVALSAISLHPAYATGCAGMDKVQLIHTTPSAISYDAYSVLHPVKATRLARMMNAQQVKLLPSKQVGCVIEDDGVADPSAVLLRIPNAAMNYWVESRAVEPVITDQQNND